MEERRQLVVYIKDSMFRFPDVYGETFFETTDAGLLVYEVNKISAEERVIAHFRNWDYLLIE